MLRILAVWLSTLFLICLWDGGDGFWVIFITYGIIMTIPALFLLGLTLLVETQLERISKLLSFLAAPLVAGIAYIVARAMAPSAENFEAAESQLFQIVAVAIAFWIASRFVFQNWKSNA